MRLGNTRGNRAADIFLQRLKARDPNAHRIIAARIAGGASMGGMGQDEYGITGDPFADPVGQDTTIWDDIRAGIGDIADAAYTIYTSEREAEQAADLAKAQAQAALMEAQAELETAQAQAQAESIRLELERQRIFLAREQQKVNAASTTSQQTMQRNLMLGGAGLLVLFLMAGGGRPKRR